jgi:hypothetical protein
VIEFFNTNCYKKKGPNLTFLAKKQGKTALDCYKKKKPWTVIRKKKASKQKKSKKT